MFRRLRERLSYKLVHSRKLPKANLHASLTKIAALGFQPRHIIDVGANKGKWSRVASQVFPGCEYTLIEPQIEMKPYLDRFCRQQNARWLLAGAGDKEGQLAFTALPDTVSSSFAFTAEDARAMGATQRSVPILTLDRVVEDMGKIPDIVKVDAEGFDAKVVRGSTKLLGITELFFLEARLLEPGTHPCGLVELIAMMSEVGYVPFDFTWFGRLRNPNVIDLCEIAFVRRDGFLRKRFMRPSRQKAA